MGRRPELHQKLKKLFEYSAKPHVYYQPPESVKLDYPCIVYKLTGLPNKHADNLPYFEHREYELTVIDSDPESILRENVAKLKWCRFKRAFVSDNLNHFVFDLNY
jgi:hypothetical protein